jgi:hypothetical protein
MRVIRPRIGGFEGKTGKGRENGTPEEYRQTQKEES